MTTQITLHAGDNRDSLRRLIDQGVRVHSVVTDPPYGLVSTVKRFGKEGSAPAKSNGPTGAFKRASAGFMGSKWDGTGIERDPEFWQLIYDILLPGAYVLAFSSPRTGHWQACAMETVGFIMHPFFGWAYGSGMPKAHNAAMAIDKHLGVEQGFIPKGDPVKRMIPGAEQHATGDWTKTDERQYQPGKRVPGSPEAEQWDGWAYGAQSMKPALEPIYFGQKPFSEKNGALNLLKHGVGAVNLDGCRVGDHPGGRHPANLLLDGSEEVAAMFPSGNDRFFNSFTPKDFSYTNGTDEEHRVDSVPLFYHSKATKGDRAGSAHPTVKPVQLMQWLCRLVTPPGGIVLDPFGGSGTTGEAARREGFDCILMEAEAQFIADIRTRFGLPDDEDPLAEFEINVSTSEHDFESMLG